MSPIEIRSGLRKLDFAPLPLQADTAGAVRVSVEFVRVAPLAPNDVVRVVLGVCDGILRELVGQPELVATRELGEGKGEYCYRIEGAVARAHS
jgi:hypothetical protein